MKKNKIISLLLFAVVTINSIYCQISWQATISLYRDDYGNLVNQNHFTIKSRLTTDTAMYLIFDYGEILTDAELSNSCSKCIENFKQLNQSLILIENERGEFTTLSDNNLEGYKPSKGIKMSSDYDFEILGIDVGLLRKWQIPYSFPLSKLFSCGKTSKVRLHYFYKHNDKFSKFRDNSFYMISDWISIDSIK